MRVFKYTASVTIFLWLGFAISCSKDAGINDATLQQEFKKADSLIYSGAKDAAITLLLKLKPHINENSPYYSTYYYLQAEQVRENPELMNTYADSALAFFKNEQLEEKYPDEYYNALLVKGDAAYLDKQYYRAFDNYFKANNIVLNKRCDYGAVSSKIANVYFFQKDYKSAAKHLINSYKKLLICHEALPPQTYFYLSQGILDNTGLAYEKAGMFDSARYYYNKDIELIAEAEKNKQADKKMVSTAKMIVLDNLGGLNLKEGKTAEANTLLTTCLQTPVNSKFPYITPVIKLANLHMITGNYTVADSFMQLSRKYLDSMPRLNAELEMRWQKLYAQFNEETGRHELANKAYKKYAQVKDSYDNSYTSLYKINVDRELETLQHKQVLAELKHKENLVWTYILGLALAVAMSIIIIILIYRNLKAAQKLHKKTIDHNNELQQALEEVEKANKNYIRIMRVMAHDLNNPLSGMTGLANILANDDTLSAENKHMLQMIESTGNHAMEMINELLKTGLADENEAIIIQPHNLVEILEESIALLQFKAKDKEQEIIFNHNSEPIIANVNKDKMWRVFNNLIGNAIKFTNPGGKITIGIQGFKGNKEVIISVADNGVGIPDALKDKVFEMFTAAKRQGTGGEQPFGLGLSISKKIIEKHRGRIWFDSKQSAGTTFYIALPYS